MDPAYTIAKHLAQTQFEDLPKDAVETAKKFVLNILGCALTGSTAVGCREVADLMAQWGGKPESTVIAYGHRLPSPHAALVNATFAQARDFDDIHDVAGVYINVAVVPAALAVAEATGAVGGRELITAVALGTDLACRLGLSLQVYKGWHFTEVCGCFGATAAAAKILGLDEERTLHALGIALSQASGTIQSIRDAALVKRVQPGFAAQAGIISAYLAKQGITGSRNVFEGRHGFFALFDGGARGPEEQRDPNIYKHENLTAGLGGRYEGAGITIKPYPSARGTHAAIDAALALVREHDIAADQVDEVTAHISQFAFNSNGRPFAVGENPEVEAQASIPYTVAAAILRRDVFVRDFEDEEIREPAVLRLAERVRCVVDEKSPKFAVRLEVKMREGASYTHSVAVTKGSPENPMSLADVAEKFRRCADSAANPIRPEALDEVVGLVERLEQVSDVSQLVRLLS